MGEVPLWRLPDLSADSGMDSVVVARFGAAIRLVGSAFFCLGAIGFLVTLPVLIGLPACALGIIAGVRWWRVAVVADRSYLHVRNWAWTHRIPWAAIEGWQMTSTHLGVAVSGRRYPLALDATNNQSLRSGLRSERLQETLDSLVSWAQRSAT